jgi:BASS family bile acid:Na+ symporter
VSNFVFIQPLFVGYLQTVTPSTPAEVTVRFYIAALSAGMPFARLLAKLGKANVSIATTMLV